MLDRFLGLLQAANVGDSAGVYLRAGSGDASMLHLTADHRLSNPSERQRLAGMGIELSGGRTRLYGLNVSRCLGDKFLKDEDLGLSAHPHVSDVVHVPGDEGGVVVVASDGLWDVCSAGQALQACVAVAP